MPWSILRASDDDARRTGTGRVRGGPRARLRHVVELTNWELDKAVPEDAFGSAKASGATRIGFKRPDVDSIEGLSPAISIEQKTTSRSPRSTVGTITEIYDYLRLLYASIGVPHCPKCGKPISRQSAEQIVERILSLAPGERVII